MKLIDILIFIILTNNASILFEHCVWKAAELAPKIEDLSLEWITFTLHLLLIVQWFFRFIHINQVKSKNKEFFLFEISYLTRFYVT